MKRLFNLLVLTIFIFFLITYFNENKEVINFFYKINVWYIFIFIGLAVINFVFRSFINIFIFKSLDINIQINEAFDLVIKNTIGNLLGPLKAGAGHNLHYMYKKYNLSPTLYISSNTAFAILLLFINFLLLLLVTLTIDNLFNLSSFQTVLIIVFSVLISIIVLKIFVKQKENINIKFLKNFVIGFLSLFKNKVLFIQITITAVLYSFFNVVVLYFTFIMFEFGIKFKNTLLYTTLGSFTSIVKLTPGNIGFYEFVMISSSGFHGIQTNEILTSSIFLRSANYVAIILILSLSFLRRSIKTRK